MTVNVKTNEQSHTTSFIFMLPCIVTYIFFLFNNQPDPLIIQIYSVIKLYVFRESSLPIIRSFLLRVSMELQFHPDSARKRSSETCTKLTSAEFTVENSWWWAGNMPKTCRVLEQNKFVDSKPTWCSRFLKYIYLSITLCMFRALCAHHQERSNCTNPTSELVIPFSCVPCEHYSAHKGT
jgi:hypothetical protein